MGRVNKLFLRLCAYSVTQGRLVYVPGPCAAALGSRANRESAPTVVAGGLRCGNGHGGIGHAAYVPAIHVGRGAPTPRRKIHTSSTLYFYQPIVQLQKPRDSLGRGHQLTVPRDGVIRAGGQQRFQCVRPMMRRSGARGRQDGAQLRRDGSQVAGFHVLGYGLLRRHRTSSGSTPRMASRRRPFSCP